MKNGTKYPWSLWMNGLSYAVSPSDYEVSRFTLCDALRAKAWREGVKVKVHDHGRNSDRVTFTFEKAS